METKESNEDVFHMLMNGISSASDVLISGVGMKLAAQTDGLISKMQDAAHNVQEAVIKNIVSAAALALGGIFLIFSLVFFMIDYLQLPRAVSYLIIALIMGIVGMVIRQNKR